jgi:hypothetical protein
MKEIKVTIKLIVYVDDSDEELLNEAIEKALQLKMEEGDLKYTFKAIEIDEDEENYDFDEEEDV